jgi:hypothetical protein
MQLHNKTPEHGNAITQFEGRSEKNIYQLPSERLCNQPDGEKKGQLHPMRQMLFPGISLSISRSGKPLHHLSQGTAPALQNFSPRSKGFT